MLKQEIRALHFTAQDSCTYICYVDYGFETLTDSGFTVVSG